MNELFRKFSSKTSVVVGSSYAFILAVVIIVVWAASGPAFHYSDTWQLVINTGTTIITFLMVFLIQNTQNRDAKAIHLKLRKGKTRSWSARAADGARGIGLSRAPAGFSLSRPRRSRARAGRAVSRAGSAARP